MTKTPDARSAASRLIQAARRTAPDQSVLAFGDIHQAAVGFGERDSFRVGDGAWELRHHGAVVDSGSDGPGTWKRVDEFLGAVAGHPVLGFLGFDLHRGTDSRLRSARRLSTYLAVPEDLTRVGAETVTAPAPA
nr:hypothetical protein [Actinomycetota bacterium]